MPYRKNIRFLTLLVSVVVLAVVIIGGLVLIARTNDPPAGLYAAVVGFPGLLGVQLLQMLRTEETVKAAVETVVAPMAQEIKIVAAKLEPVVEEVKIVAEKLSNGGRISSRDELKLLIAEVIRESCYGHMQNPPKVQT